MPAPRAVSGHSPRGSGPQNPYLAGQGSLKPLWCPGADCWTWGGSTPQGRCSNLGFPIPALALTWCQHPPLLLCWCCPLSFHLAPAAGQGKGWAWEAALGLQSAPMGCSDPFRALQFGVLALQQVLTSIHLPGFVGNSRERFLLPLLCLFFILACSVSGCTERDTQPSSHLPHTNQECCASW